MPEVDTSSYPKPAALPVQKSALDQVQQFQQLENGNLQINQQKLNQANQALGYMTRAMGSLGPDATKEQYLAVGQNAVKMGLVPPQMLGAYQERLAQYTKPDGSFDNKGFFNEFTTAAATHDQTINYHLGQQGTVQDNQNIYPVTTSPKFGTQQTGLPISIKNAPSTEVVDTNEFLPNGKPNPRFNQKVLLGSQGGGMVAPPGPQYNAPNRLPIANSPQAPGSPVPTQRVLPTDKNLTGPGKTFIPGDVQDLPPNQTFADRFSSAPTGPATALPPMFEEGKKQLVEDQNAATQKLTGIKNAQKALALLPGVESGPGTGPYQQALAFLKAQGVLSTDPKDKTVIYQEINKYLNRYVQQSGLSQRSDAAQQLAESSNPNLMTQLNPALVNLTRSAIGLDKVEIARPGAFGSKDYSKYGEHRTSFPQSQDDRAYSLSDLPKPEAQKLYQDMKAKALAGDPEGIKFIKSLAIANKQGL